MTPEQRAAAARAFWLDGDSLAQQAEAVTFLARQLRFRPQSILSQSDERRAKQLAMQPKPPDAVIGRALVVYHLTVQRPLLVAFLDHLAIKHENGLIAGELDAPPSAAAMEAAAAAVAAAYPAGDVRLYLGTLAVQDPDTWGGLEVIRRTIGGAPA